MTSINNLKKGNDIMFIVYNDFEEKYLSCFNAKETAENFKKEYVEKAGYGEDDILIFEAPYNAEVKDVLTPSTYNVTIRSSAETTYSIEANNEEEAMDKAYELFGDGNDFDYVTEIIEIYEEEK